MAAPVFHPIQSGLSWIYISILFELSYKINCEVCKSDVQENIGTAHQVTINILFGAIPEVP